MVLRDKNPRLRAIVLLSIVICDTWQHTLSIYVVYMRNAALQGAYLRVKSLQNYLFSNQRWRIQRRQRVNFQHCSFSDAMRMRGKNV